MSRLRRPRAGRRVGALLSVAVLAVLGVGTARMLRLPSRQMEAPPAPPLGLGPEEAAASAARLAGALRIATVSAEGGSDPAALEELHAHLRASFPRVHGALARELVGGASVLYGWAGSEPLLAPLLLCAHLDVVPADPAAWTHPPFGGVVEGGFVWGRGALDDKASALALLEAVELLLGRGWSPRRTVLLAFGHDEELGGAAGAAAIAAELARRGVRPGLVLDEGGSLVEGIVPGVAAPVALIGIAEKGYATVRLSARGEGGHSSMPPASTPVGRVAAAVASLEAHPFRARLDGVARTHLEFLAPELPFGRRFLLANLWLSAPLVERSLLATPETAALVRTTLAATRIEGGSKENVLPRGASALVNLRLLPGTSVAEALARIERVVDDPEVAVELVPGAWEPTRVAPVDAPAFRCLQRTVAQLFPGAVVAPYLVVGGTDARHYEGIAEAVYRFLPLRLVGQADVRRLHGVDERIALDDYLGMIAFYVRLLEAAQETGALEPTASTDA